jgi:hypothetical protein
MQRRMIQRNRKKVACATVRARAMQRRRSPAVTLSGPVSFPSIPLSTYCTPLTPGIDLQVKLELSVQLVPSPTVNPAQVTIPAELAQAVANWIIENPGKALLYGAGAAVFIAWLSSLSRPEPRLSAGSLNSGFAQSMFNTQR